MQLLCPECRLPLAADFYCANSHGFGHSNGVLRLLTAEFAQQLDEFSAQVQRFRQAQGRRIIDPSIYEHLPEALAPTDFQWRLRSYDLEIVQQLLAGREGLHVLDVGAWNGWLSHRLALLDHHVTAVDYFADEYDGLGASRFYSTHFLAIQMNLLDLEILAQPFDLVILNRCLQFQPDPLAFVHLARKMLAPDGLVLALGLEFFFASSRKARQVENLIRQVREDYDFDLFLRPTKGYLDQQDRENLTAAGMKMQRYPQLQIANLRARLQSHRPRHEYGLLTRPVLEVDG